MTSLVAEVSTTRVHLHGATSLLRDRVTALVRDGRISALTTSAPGARLHDELTRHRPDVLLVEVSAARSDGDARSLVEQLRQMPAPPPIVVFGDVAAMTWRTDVARLGIRGILPGSASSQEIGAAVLAAAAGLVVLHGDALDARQARRRSRRAPDPEERSLTPREIEILDMVAEGLANKQIAARLKISPETVKFHVAALRGKLNAASRTEAVSIGVRRGLIFL